MKLKYVETLATPGPFKTQAGTYIVRDHDNISTSQDIADCYETMDSRLDEGNANANAALLAHWYNVGPNLLAVLKNYMGSTDYESEALEVIAAAEEVEGI